MFNMVRDDCPTVPSTPQLCGASSMHAASFVLLTSDLVAATGCRVAACGAASCCTRLGLCAAGQVEVDTQFWESVCIKLKAAYIKSESSTSTGS